MHTKSVTKVLTILSPSIVLRALAMDIFIPCITAVAFELGSTPGNAQWVLSIYFIGAGLGQLIIGPLADHFGRRKVILGSIVLFVFSSIACSMSTSIMELIITRLFQGVGACGSTVVTLAIIRDLYEDHMTPRVYTHVYSIIGLAPLLAPLLGGSLLVWTGNWRSSFYFVTAFGLLAFVINYFFLKETNPRFNNKLEVVNLKIIKHYKEIISSTEFLTYTYCAIACLSSLFLFFSLSSVLLIRMLAVSPEIYGYYFGFNSLMCLSANMLSPWLQRKFGVKQIMIAGSYIMLLGAGFMLWLNWGFGLSKSALLLPNAVLTFGIGLLLGPCTAGAMRPFKHIAGTAAATYGALLYCLSALIVAGIMQFKIVNALPLAIMVLFMASVNILVLRRPRLS
jgi:DHA1 family bicyclomycin/chloramphenicol resistance-like MFS transporter